MVIDDSYEHALSSTENQRPRTILELKFSHPDLRSASFLDDEDGGLLIDEADKIVGRSVRSQEGEGNDDNDDNDNRDDL